MLSHPTVPFIPYSIPSYPFHTFYTPRFPSIYILLHSTLSYSSILYPKLPHPIPTETDHNDPGLKRLVLLGQIDLPSGDFGPRPGAPDISAARRFSTKPVNTPRRFGTKTFRHQNISTQDGWMDVRPDGWMDGWVHRWVARMVDGWMNIFQLHVLRSHV